MVTTKPVRLTMTVLSLKPGLNQRFLSVLLISGSGLVGFGEAQQKVAVVFVLLLTQRDFAGQAVANGFRKGVELIENSGDPRLLGKRSICFTRIRNGYLEILYDA